MGGGREEQELDAATGEGEGSINGSVLPVLMRRDTVSKNSVVLLWCGFSVQLLSYSAHL
ncbi:hypothetical protein J3E69DRAFT_347941 [Trichoderma sp. SZMC 28015]